MKVESSLNKIIIYIYDNKYFNKEIKDIIKEIFEELKKYYNLVYSDSYNLTLYINKYYGMILEIEDISGIISNNIVSLKLKILNDVLFLYETDDPLNFFNNEIYYYNEKFYVNMKNMDIKLYEFTNIIYGKEVYKIIGKGTKIL